ncbi:MAG TPA: ATPase [Prolixibacteraceae bacterium]|jgi:predicted AAA+ superfamily ATPase|nr:ATPase [Prolixibacteraceae bacterium]
MNYIARPTYSEKIQPFIGKQIIKVLTGQRRVGKSYIMLQLMDHIKENNPSANIIYINRELEKFSHINTNIDLNEYLEDKFPEDKANFLFIDEIQEIESFQLTIRSLFAENKCDIFCTGSNANMLSGELATYLSGRYIEFKIHSLSFSEFLIFHHLEKENASLMKYLTYGGMPYLPNIGLQDDLPFEYLRNVYSTILLKDVVARENIRNIHFLENLVFYLSDNIGSLFSASNISKFLKSQRVEISTQLTLHYLKALSNAYFVYRVVRSEVGGLKIFEIGEKYYFEDLGLRNALKGFNQITDIHKLLENAVYLHLLQCGYRIYVGKIDHKEIDFVADRNGLKIYVQVCLQITDQTVQEREFGNLLLIEDNYPKYVVTLNDLIIGGDYQGIKQINLLDFLLLKL